MGFKSIGDLAISVLAKLDIEATEEGCAVEAHSLRPATGKRVATDAGEGGTTPVAFAQGGEVAAEQTENGLPVYFAPRTGKEGSNNAAPKGAKSRTLRELNKGTGANPGQLGGQEERQTRAISRNWKAISASLRDMRRCMGRETAARAPRAARPIHLCIDNGHASQPMA